MGIFRALSGDFCCSSIRCSIDEELFTQSRAAWAEVSSEPEQFIAAGNRIVVFVHARVRPRDRSEWQDVRLADVYTVRNGKGIQMRAFADRQEALRWVGAEGLNR